MRLVFGSGVRFRFGGMVGGFVAVFSYFVFVCLGLVVWFLGRA